MALAKAKIRPCKAVEQALHHPLLESISIDGATGIIANFTGGSGLTFLEVMDALNHLQELTRNQADIIPGVINDPRMEDRAQVILVITGLGATPVETALPARAAQPATVKVSSPAAVPRPFSRSRKSARSRAFPRRAALPPWASPLPGRRWCDGGANAIDRSYRPGSPRFHAPPVAVARCKARN